MQRSHRIALCGLLALLAPPCFGQGFADPHANPQFHERDVYSDTWAAVDGLGRHVSGPARPAARKPRQVAVFYFTANHMDHGTIYDITKLLAANPAHPAYGPFGYPEWWGQPWLGYYQSNDEAAIRTHMQMLADAGVDTIVCDNTNGPTYPDVYLVICKVMREMRAQGSRTPQIAFFAGHNAWSTIYHDFYAAGLYRDLWFQWGGKPLLMVHTEPGDVIPDEVRKFFTIRESWAWTPSAWFGTGQDKWPWLDNYPQSAGWHDSPSHPEEISVSVAQHATTSIGRSSLSQREPPVDDLRLTPDCTKGLCFAQQFERALKVDPDLIFVTGWNEWTAGRYTQDPAGGFAGRPNPAGAPIFVDEYNEEFSRDIEPEEGRLQDNYYYQFVDFVRRYKGARAVPPVPARTIKIGGDFAQWAAVTPEYRDAIGDPIHRDNAGWADLRYVNRTGRNDIVASKVTSDNKNVYFYARTAAPLSPRSGKSWMLLYINTRGARSTGWLGYDYVVNRAPGLTTTAVQRNEGGRYEWRSVGAAGLKAAGNQLMVAIPRTVLGLPRKGGAIQFKWADGIEQNGQASDFTINGDAAPNGRFNYTARLQ